MQVDDRREELDRLYSENTGLAYYVAHKLLRSWGLDTTPMPDWAEDAATLGLAKAVVHYDPARAKFSSFAARVVDNEIRMASRKRRHDPMRLVASLDAPVTDDPDALPLAHYIADERAARSFDDAETGTTIGPRLRRALAGITQAEQAAADGVSRSDVSKLVQRDLRRWALASGYDPDRRVVSVTWTPEMDADLIRRWAANESVADIARALGLPSTQHVYNRRFVPRHKGLWPEGAEREAEAPEAPVTRYFECQGCGDRFEEAEALAAHRRVHEAPPPAPEPPAEPPPAPPQAAAPATFDVSLVADLVPADLEYATQAVVVGSRVRGVIEATVGRLLIDPGRLYVVEVRVRDKGAADA